MKISAKQVIEANDWDELVSKTYGKPYSYQQQDGCRGRGIDYLTVPSEYADEDNMPDSVPEIINSEKMGVKFSSWLARDPKQKLEKQECDFELELWWKRNFYPSIYSIANDLHIKGLLPAGKYMIKINWHC